MSDLFKWIIGYLMYNSINFKMHVHTVSGVIHYFYISGDIKDDEENGWWIIHDSNKYSAYDIIDMNVSLRLSSENDAILLNEYLAKEYIDKYLKY